LKTAAADGSPPKARDAATTTQIRNARTVDMEDILATGGEAGHEWERHRYL
jgi:hypothetical protein